MRIAISTLPSHEAKSLADLLEKAGHLVVSEFPSYTVDISSGSRTVVDVPDAMFGRLAVFRIGELTKNPVSVQVSGGNLDDTKIVAKVTPEDLEAVCVGILRAVDQTKKFSEPKHKELADANTELFVNLWEAIKTEQREFLESQRTLNEEQNTIIREQLKNQENTLHQDLGHTINLVHDNIVDLVQHKSQLLRGDVEILSRRLVDHTTKSKKELFSDLITYYTRKRWWEFWR